MDPAEHRAAWLDVLHRRSAQVPHALPSRVRGRQLEAWLDEAVSRCHDELWARRFSRACPRPGLGAAAYAHRVVGVLGEALLTGLRFYGGDPELPFVDLLAWGPRVDALVDWGPVVQRVLAAHSDAGADRLRVRWPGEGRPPVDTASRSLDQVLVAAPLAELRRGHRPWGWGSVDVRRARSLENLPRYRAAFDRWRRDSPRLARRVGAARERVLQDALLTGVVVEAWQGARWCGWMAARSKRARVHEGYEVVSFFLDAGLRGRRRSPVLQRHLIEQLRDRGRDCLHGTVDGQNRPSLRAALRCGRAIAEQWHFLGPGVLRA